MAMGKGEVRDIELITDDLVHTEERYKLIFK